DTLVITGAAAVLRITYTYNYSIPIITPTRQRPVSNCIYMRLWPLQMLKFGFVTVGTRGKNGKVKTPQVILILLIQMYQNPQMIKNQERGLILINYLNRLMIN